MPVGGRASKSILMCGLLASIASLNAASLSCLEIARLTRLFVLGNYDLLLDMVNGHRLRICGNIMTVSKKEMEDVAQAIETLLSRRQGGIG